MNRRGFLQLLGIGLPALAVGSVLPAAPPQAALEVGLSAVFDGLTHDDAGVISSMKYGLVEAFDRELFEMDSYKITAFNAKGEVVGTGWEQIHAGR